MAAYEESSSGKRLDVTSLYNNIKPGDTTHESTLLKFNEYFNKFSRRMKIYIHLSNEPTVQQLPCFVLQVAYDQCRQYILTDLLKETFSERIKDYQIPKELTQLSIFKTNTGNQGKSLDELFKLEATEKDWELLKAGYGVFLYISDAKSDQPFKTLINETLGVLPDVSLPDGKIKEMVDKAVHIAWDLVTLVPPALLHRPVEYQEEWHEKRITSWDEDSPPDPVVYFRPVLFYSALGHVGCKGAIGNTRSRDMKVFECQYRSSFSEEQSIEEHPEIATVTMEDTKIQMEQESGMIQPSLVNRYSLAECGPAWRNTADNLFLGKTSVTEDFTNMHIPDSVCRNIEATSENGYSILDSSTERNISINIANDSNKEELSTFYQQTISGDLEPKKASSQDTTVLQPSNHETVTCDVWRHNDDINDRETYESDNIITTDSTPTDDSPETNNTSTDVSYQNRPGTAPINNGSFVGKELMLEITNMFRNIKSGDTTHDHVRLAFNDYFVKFSKRMKTFVHYQNVLQLLPCAVLQVAYDLCVQYILSGPVMEIFVNSVSCYEQLPEQVVKLLLDTRDINGIFQSCTEKSEEDWTLLKTCYSCLLYVANAKSLQPFTEIRNKVLNALPVWTEEFNEQMLEEAVHLAWDMVTLVPPAIVCQPEEYQEEWHEIRVTYWNDDLSLDAPLIYFQPVLFYSTLGHVCHKGIVGNELVSSAVILKQEETMSSICGETKVTAADTITNDTVIDTCTSTSTTATNSFKNMPSYDELSMIWLPCSQCGKWELRISEKPYICRECLMPFSRMIQSTEESSFSEAEETNLHSRHSRIGPNDYLALSMLTLLCCFCPFSVIACIYSLKTREHSKYGRYKKARIASKEAWKYNFLSVTFGSFLGILIIILIIIGFMVFLFQF